MSNRELEIAFADYDRTAALPNGAVTIDGVDANFHTARIVTEIFEGMIRRRAYDVAELGWTYYLRTFVDGSSPFIAIPVFPNRAFRHGAIYVNKASGIKQPEDLIGKRIGELALYGHDAGVIPRASLPTNMGLGQSGTDGSWAASTSRWTRSTSSPIRCLRASRWNGLASTST